MIVFLLSVVCMWNLVASGIIQPGQGKPKVEQGASENPETMQNDIKSKLGASTEKPKPPVETARSTTMGSLLVPAKMTANKPKPTDSMTSGQWYAKESGVGNKN